MQISLELYLNDMDRDPLATVICNIAPRIGECINLLAGEDPETGSYRVLSLEHILDVRRHDTLQHVCAVVIRA